MRLPSGMCDLTRSREEAIPAGAPADATSREPAAPAATPGDERTMEKAEPAHAVGGWEDGSDTPAQGTIRIQARGGWQAVDLGELWRYRELLWILALRDIKVRYKQTVLGAAWAIIQPV